MDPSVRNLLYRRPELYELAYPEPNDETPAMCLLLSHSPSRQRA